MSAWSSLMGTIAWDVWLRLGEPSGTFADSSGHSHTGTAVGALTRGVTGLVTSDTDAAVSNNGTSGVYVDVSGYTVDLSTDRTFLAIVKTSATNQQRFVTGASDAQSLFVNTNQAQFFAGGVSAVGGSISGGAKHLLVGTYKASTNAVVLYVDGVQAATATGTAQTGIGSLRLGARNTNGAGAVNGTYDECAVMASVLDATTVASLWNAANGISPPAPTTTPVDDARWYTAAEQERANRQAEKQRRPARKPHVDLVLDETDWDEEELAFLLALDLLDFDVTDT